MSIMSLALSPCPRNTIPPTRCLHASRSASSERYWICAGHHSRIPNAGDYFLLNIFDESLIILRDRQGQVRAFYNVCRHRGTRICEQAEGRFSGSLQCSYHAWTYGLDGKLIGAPFMKEVKDFRWEDYPLASGAG